MAVVTPKKMCVVRVVCKERPELGPKGRWSCPAGRDPCEALHSLPWRIVPTTWQYSS